jgi:G3E family GTPase
MVPGARLLETVQAQAPLPLLLGVSHYAWPTPNRNQDQTRVDRISARDVLDIRVHAETGIVPAEDTIAEHTTVEEHCHHNHSLVFSTWTYLSAAPLDVELVQRAVDRLPSRIYRAKGILHLADPADRPGILQMVGRRARITAGEPWDARPRQTQLVFIGEEGAIDAHELQQRFDACRPGHSSRLRNWLEDAIDWVRKA